MMGLPITVPDRVTHPRCTTRSALAVLLLFLAWPFACWLFG